MTPLPASPVTGIVFLIVALSLNSIKDGLAKMLDGYYPTAYLLCVQLIVASLILVPIIVHRYGRGVLIPRPLPQQVIRSVFFVGGVGLFYWSLNFIPLADATSMVFVAPLVVTAVSPFFLGEKLGAHRITAVIVGFAGVIVMTRPDLDGDRAGYFIALAAGGTLGFFYMMNRKLAALQPQLVAVTHASLIGAILLLPTAPFLWVPFRLEDGLIIAGFLVFALAGQVLLISAFTYTPASVLAPFQYTQLVAATLFGVIVFDAFPDGMTWLGIALVVIAGLYVAYRESRKSR
jgi:drug/metabolite transporter (DMT)-like permease